MAVVERRGKFLVAEPFFGPGPRMALNRDSRYGEGDLVLVEPGQPARGHGKGGGSRARVVRRLGRPDVARDVIEGLMLDRGLRRGFDPTVARAARLGAEAAVDDGLAGRRDLRDLETFTIDPDTARDFDDAISCRPEAGGFRVWVHIADVSSYVTARSVVDREAYRRGTSVYVPGAVEPMLPVELSNGVCSLVPGETRRALTVELSVRDGEVRTSAFYSALIRSDRRLTYAQVDRIFAGAERAEDPWGPGLAAARACAASLGERRAGAALVLESSEPGFRFDRAGHVTAIDQEFQTESHRLIETLMIAANEQVARCLEAAKRPALFRVHERPEPMAVERMIDQLASLGVPTPPVPAGPLTPQQAGDVAGEASALVADWVRRHDGRGAVALHRIVLRSLKQAVYLDTNKGHSGLALHSYCHFTSPIRRYPDLVCHRALMSLISGDHPAPEVSFVSAAGSVCSAAERAAMVIERDADDIARCFLLERTLFETAGRPTGGGAPTGTTPATFDGEIVGIIGAGAFVAFGPALEYEGMLPVRHLRHDWFELNEAGTALIGERGGALRLGDGVRVEVNAIDAPRGRVDLVLVPQE
ncbi:MAG TPA: RNB domain-containing ribonuclease [Solirubrobacteraceae bacterium]|nr:RNB domain-containing ribonuclease [Solirubrobacteraceae bacterium]